MNICIKFGLICSARYARKYQMEGGAVMPAKTDRLSESLEDYLEVIIDLEKTQKVARVRDIAERLGVLRGSVTGALKNLNEKGLINHEPYGYITLTTLGAKMASEVTRRHSVIKDFLFNVLQLGDDAAEANACRMEHAMDKGAIDRLVEFIDYVNNCPRAGQDWILSFVKACSSGDLDPQKCNDCLDDAVAHYQES